jgi:hypothetical protein
MKAVIDSVKIFPIEPLKIPHVFTPVVRIRNLFLVQVLIIESNSPKQTTRHNRKNHPILVLHSFEFAESLNGQVE